jgi:hypothetical protein
VRQTPSPLSLNNTTLTLNSSGTGGIDTLQAAQDAIAIVGDLR